MRGFGSVVSPFVADVDHKRARGFRHRRNAERYGQPVAVGAIDAYPSGDGHIELLPVGGLQQQVDCGRLTRGERRHLHRSGRRHPSARRQCQRYVACIATPNVGYRDRVIARLALGHGCCYRLGRCLQLAFRAAAIIINGGFKRLAVGRRHPDANLFPFVALAHGVAGDGVSQAHGAPAIYRLAAFELHVASFGLARHLGLHPGERRAAWVVDAYRAAVRYAQRYLGGNVAA